MSLNTLIEQILLSEQQLHKQTEQIEEGMFYFFVYIRCLFKIYGKVFCIFTYLKSCVKYAWRILLGFFVIILTYDFIYYLTKQQYLKLWC